MTPPSDPGASHKPLCALVIGRWLSHPCAAPAAKRCGRCGRATCERHLSKTTAGQCLECAGEHRPPAGPVHVGIDEITSFTPEEIRAFDALPEGGAQGAPSALVPHGS